MAASRRSTRSPLKRFLLRKATLSQLAPPVEDDQRGTTVPKDATGNQRCPSAILRHCNERQVSTRLRQPADLGRTAQADPKRSFGDAGRDQRALETAVTSSPGREPPRATHCCI